MVCIRCKFCSYPSHCPSHSLQRETRHRDTSIMTEEKNEPQDHPVEDAATSPPAAVVADAETKKSSRKSWRGLPSFPVLKILQGIFLILMIGQNLPGPHKRLWPFGSSKDTSSSNQQIQKPYYVEMRSDLYGHERQFPVKEESDGGLFRLLLGPKPPPLTVPSNTGVPNQQNIVLTLVNHEYESYRYSVQAATTSKVQATKEYGYGAFQRALGKVMPRITDPRERKQLTLLEERFLEDASAIVDKMDHLRHLLLVDTNTTSDTEECINNATNATSTAPSFGSESQSQKLQCNANETRSYVPKSQRQQKARNSTIASIEAAKAALGVRVVSFVKDITGILRPGPGNAIKDALVGHYFNFGYVAFVQDLQKGPMRLHFTPNKKRLYVTYFWGDLFATAVVALRKEVTAIVSNAESDDEVLVVLSSAGGTVTGYGLVAAQLLRIKEAGLKLTIAVEQVAASGGYMAACVGDTIVCSPFAVVGSIGVVQAMPNFHERLKREGIEFHEITAGEHKRVLSPTKEASPQDLKKAKEDMEVLWGQFKDFVLEQRPSLNMELVATGDVWFGKRAQEVGLCDEIQAYDNVLTDYMDQGYDVYRVKYEEHTEDYFDRFVKLFESSATQNVDVGSSLRWLLRKITALLQVNAAWDNAYDQVLFV